MRASICVWQLIASIYYCIHTYENPLESAYVSVYVWTSTPSMCTWMIGFPSAIERRSLSYDETETNNVQAHTFESSRVNTDAPNTVSYTRCWVKNRRFGCHQRKYKLIRKYSWQSIITEIFRNCFSSELFSFNLDVSSYISENQPEKASAPRHNTVAAPIIQDEKETQRLRMRGKIRYATVCGWLSTSKSKV